MTFYQSILLGIIQGLTEFLPVSSSGHLVIFQKLLGLSSPPVFFDVLVHVGTLLSVLVYFKDNIIDFYKSHFWLIIIGSIPAGVVGLLLNSHTEVIFNSLELVGLALLITGFLLLSTNFLKVKKTDKLNFSKSFIIGIFQALAIIPGISRSGSTIAVGLWQGLKRKTAFAFSFFLSLPAIMAALGLQLSGVNFATIDWLATIIGFFTAFISGLLALKILEKMVLQGRLLYFSFYCFALGVLILLV
jgi:undecaprenyl-diphosphatase